MQACGSGQACSLSGIYVNPRLRLAERSLVLQKVRRRPRRETQPRNSTLFTQIRCTDEPSSYGSMKTDNSTDIRFDTVMCLISGAQGS